MLVKLCSSCARDLDESARFGVPGLLADLHAGGAGQEVEGVVVVVVMRWGIRRQGRIWFSGR